MKKLLIAAFTLSLISCQKNNITYRHHWKTIEGHDVTTFDHAAFCDSSDYGIIDTVELDNTAANNPDKFSEGVGDIVFHIPNGRVATDVPGIYDRYYSKLLKQID